MPSQAHELTRLRSQEWFTEDRRFKAPESARALLTSSPNIIPLCDFYPDEEWNTFCQVRSLAAGKPSPKLITSP